MQNLHEISKLETICKKFQNLFSGENKKNIINVSSATVAQRVAQVKENQQIGKQPNAWIKKYFKMLSDDNFTQHAKR